MRTGGVNLQMCQKAYSGIASGRHGLGKPGLWLAAGTKKEREPGKPALLLYILHGIRHVIRVVGDARCRVGHGIASSNQFKHLHIIVLITESNAFFRTDPEQFQKVSESSPLVCARSNEIDPDIS